MAAIGCTLWVDYRHHVRMARQMASGDCRRHRYHARKFVSSICETCPLKLVFHDIEFEDAGRTRDYACLLDIRVPKTQQRCEHHWMSRGQIVCLSTIFGKIVELPSSRAMRFRDKDRFPLPLANRTTTEQLPSCCSLRFMHFIVRAFQVFHE